MSVAARIAGLGLGALFAWAGAAKLADVSSTTSSFVGLGVPAPALAARVVPTVELGLAAALAVTPAPAGIASLVVLAFFTTLLVTRLRQGVRVGCGCFGSPSRKPLGWGHVARNAALAVLALIAATA